MTTYLTIDADFTTTVWDTEPAGVATAIDFGNWDGALLKLDEGILYEYLCYTGTSENDAPVGIWQPVERGIQHDTES